MAAYEAASVQPSNPQVALLAAAQIRRSAMSEEQNTYQTLNAAEAYLSWLDEKDSLQ